VKRKHWSKRNRRKAQNARARKRKRLGIRRGAPAPITSPSFAYPPCGMIGSAKPKREGFVKTTSGPLPRDPSNEPGDFMDWDYT